MIPLTCLIRTKDVKKIDGFSLKFTQGIEDWDFWIRFFEPNDKIARVNRPLFYYRRQEISRNTSLKKSSNQMSKMLEQLYMNNKAIYQQFPNVKKYMCPSPNTQISRIIRVIYYLFIGMKEVSVFTL